jgi:hypothetical protein
VSDINQPTLINILIDLFSSMGTYFETVSTIRVELEFYSASRVFSSPYTLHPSGISYMLGYYFKYGLLHLRCFCIFIHASKRHFPTWLPSSSYTLTFSDLVSLRCRFKGSIILNSFTNNYFSLKHVLSPQVLLSSATFL